jgi:hypothetical protein
MMASPYRLTCAPAVLCPCLHSSAARSKSLHSEHLTCQDTQIRRKPQRQVHTAWGSAHMPSSPDSLTTSCHVPEHSANPLPCSCSIVRCDQAHVAQSRPHTTASSASAQWPSPHSFPALLQPALPARPGAWPSPGPSTPGCPAHPALPRAALRMMGA